MSVGVDAHRATGPRVRTATLARRSRERRVAWGAAAAALIVALVALCLGGYPLSPAAVARTIAGSGTTAEAFVIFDVRMPRIVLGLVVGAALALSGALLQSLLANPLASPDIIGVTQGASAGAAWALLIAGLGTTGVAASALAGAAAAAVAIHLLAWRDGVTGERFVLIGIGIAFMAHGALGYMLTRADVREAQAAMTWLVGSLGSARWADIVLVSAVLAVLLPAAVVATGHLRALQLGDPAARALGVPVQRSRLAIVATAVALAAVATAVAGPVAFVAFMAAPVARRLVGSGSPTLVPAALVGAVIVVAADLVGRHLLPGDIQVPVGVITGAVGAPYLLWLLATRDRPRSGA